MPAAGVGALAPLDARALAQSAAQSAVLSPPDGKAYATLDPIEITGHAYAPEALRALTVTVSSVPISTTTWATADVTETLWTTSWTPPGDGVYTITAQIADWAGGTTTETVPAPAITVDTVPPAVLLTTDVISSAGFTGAGYVTVRGLVTDTFGIAGLQVRYNGGPWAGAVVPTPPHAFAAPVWTGSNVPPDGEWATLHARVTDLAGNTAEISRTAWVDAQPPEPVTVTLSYLNASSVQTVITPGATIRDVLAPTLDIAWTGSMSADVVGYLAGWTTSPDLDGALTAYGPLGRVHHQGVGEAQQVYAHVVVVDASGNRTVQTVGPVMVDYEQTPAYAAAAYEGWLDEPCNLIGVDRRAARSGAAETSSTLEQRFYATWTTDTLRLAWAGADWDVDGDLFVYLDIAAGGTSETLNPYVDDAGTHVYLPGVTPTTLPGGVSRAGDPAPAMLADLMVRVSDDATAWLWRWDGSTWVTQTQLAAAQFAYDPALRDGLTDLALPYDLLGLPSDGSGSLGLVAFASEDEAPRTAGLRLWAAMPPQNPVNSTLAGPALAGQADFALARGYLWPALGSGVCPAASEPRHGRYARRDHGAGRHRCPLPGRRPGRALGPDARHAACRRQYGLQFRRYPRPATGDGPGCDLCPDVSQPRQCHRRGCEARGPGALRPAVVGRCGRPAGDHAGGRCRRWRGGRDPARCDRGRGPHRGPRSTCWSTIRPILRAGRPWSGSGSTIRWTPPRRPSTAFKRLTTWCRQHDHAQRLRVRRLGRLRGGPARSDAR